MMQPQNSEAMQKVVMAGMKLMYSKQVFPMFADALEKDPSPMGIAKQTAGLMKILMDKSQRQIPKNVMIPAAVALLFEMAGFMVQAGMPKPSDEDMQGALKALVQMMVQVFGGQQPGAPGAPPAQPTGAQPPQAVQPGMIGA